MEQELLELTCEGCHERKVGVFYCKNFGMELCDDCIREFQQDDWEGSDWEDD